MKWNRIKSFMLAFLLLVNIIFIYMLSTLDNPSYNNSDYLNAQKILKESGIEIDTELLKTDINDGYVYYQEIYDNYNKGICSVFLKGKNINSYSVPDGIMYVSDTNETLYIGDDNEIRYTSQEKTENYDFESSEHISDRKKEELENKISSVLFKGNQTTLNVSVLAASSKGKISTVKIGETANDYFIDSYQAVIQLKDNDIISFDGKWCFLNNLEQNEEPNYDMINIMFIEKNRIFENQDQSGDDVYQVKSLNQCYRAIISPNNHIYLLPSVKIDYENGKSSLIEIIKAD